MFSTEKKKTRKVKLFDTFIEDIFFFVPFSMSIHFILSCSLTISISTIFCYLYMCVRFLVEFVKKKKCPLAEFSSSQCHQMQSIRRNYECEMDLSLFGEIFGESYFHFEMILNLSWFLFPFEMEMGTNTPEK